jgi:hypothetical protein
MFFSSRFNEIHSTLTHPLHHQHGETSAHARWNYRPKAAENSRLPCLPISDDAIRLPSCRPRNQRQTHAWLFSPCCVPACLRPRVFCSYSVCEFQHTCSVVPCADDVRLSIAFVLSWVYLFWTCYLLRTIQQRQTTAPGGGKRKHQIYSSDTTSTSHLYTGTQKNSWLVRRDYRRPWHFLVRAWW